VFSHITFGCDDLEAAGKFYDALLIPHRPYDRRAAGPAMARGYYGAYLRDPGSNKVHIVYRGDLFGS
jgi:catechol 2,3-dioxygenase-like lactoylglutathione lyase family enzyme